MTGAASRISRTAPGALFILVSLLWLSPLWAHPDQVPFQPGSEYSDLLVAHLPNAIFFQRAWQLWGQIPLWNPSILGGMPFAADPLASLWYPPHWPALVWPRPLTLNLLVALHLVWSALGVYLLAQREGLGRAGALTAAVAFSGAPKLIGHIGLGHVTLVYAVAWTPWALLLVAGAFRAGPDGRHARLRQSILAGACLGAVFLADPRWLVPTALLAMAYAMRMVLGTGRAWSEVRRRWIDALAAAGAGMAVSAGLAIPLLEFLPRTTRADLADGAGTSLALPAARLIGLLIPDRGGWAEWMLFPGLGVLLLALIAAVLGGRRATFWGATGLAAVWLSLGDAGLLFGVVRWLVPGLSLLRVPPRFMFIGTLALALLAGFGMQAVVDGRAGLSQTRRLRLALFGLLVFYGLTAGALHFWVREPQRGLTSSLWGMSLLTVAYLTLTALWRRPDGRGQGLALMGWLAVIALELAWVDASLLEPRPVELEATLSVSPPGMRAQPYGHHRVFSPSYSLPQHLAAWHGLELADGVHPLQLAAYRDFMAEATGFSPEGYSVTLPPFPQGDPTYAWEVMPDAEMLGWLNVGYIVSAYPVEAEGFNAGAALGDAHVYRNARRRPRAWIQAESGLRREQSWSPAGQLMWSPNEITLEAEGPGWLILSELDYPGWQARVDGQPTQVAAVDGLLRGVRLGPGEHEVEFRFRPMSVFVGGLLGLLGWFGTLGVWIKR